MLNWAQDLLCIAAEQLVSVRGCKQRGLVTGHLGTNARANIKQMPGRFVYQFRSKIKEKILCLYTVPTKTAVQGMAGDHKYYDLFSFYCFLGFNKIFLNIFIG